VRGLVLCPSYPRHAPVGSHDDEGGEIALKRAVQEGEALDVEHVDFVDEEDLRRGVALARLPVGNFA
jgi:hypothetical protein